ncbi:MAG TPA: cytochrome c biogenesis protein CcsA [Candidatus Synoicihabitans sp.]|nr:cytochrome c biogenesis protein CcsA [Candidatus Synoicihabitans sp.]
MKRFVPLLILFLALLYLGSTLWPRTPKTEFDLRGFGDLPVLANGRIKPMDTVARSSLLLIQNRQRVVTADGRRLTPNEWLLDAFFRPELADSYPTFRIDSPQVLELFGITEDDRRIVHEHPVKKFLSILGLTSGHRSRFSYLELAPHLAELDRQAGLAAAVEAPVRDAFQRAVLNARQHVLHYQQLKHSLVMPDGRDFLAELQRLQDEIGPGVAAIRARRDQQPHDEALAGRIIASGETFMRMQQIANLLPIPPLDPAQDALAWQNTGQALLESFQTGTVHPYALAYAGLAHAWRTESPEQFNTIIRLFRAQLEQRFAAQLSKAAAEARFNAAAPFSSGMYLYVAAFLLGIVSWLRWPDVLGRSAFWLLTLAWIATTAGIATRMWLEGRPPVTNLYSSALFVGWAAVGLCLILERIYRNAIGSVAGSSIGFCTLLIAHHLSLSGDTLEMMRAVLDSNFWLATHVIVIVIGYGATFLAGFLAIIYILRGVFSRSLDRATADALGRMVYGIVCFATLFSLIGTVLGGIWADQSWGRFWGWDPKENGALIIVLWNAAILHARWGGLARTRGIMAMAVFGNVVTSWSWFGTNMLGIGLHSYGFMDAAFWTLIGFVFSQLVLIALAYIPREKWRSASALAAS